MRGTISPRRPSRSSYSRYVRPRLEALEDRFLPSGSPVGPIVTQTISSLNLQNGYPQQELVLPDGKILLGMSFLDGFQAVPMANSNPANSGPIVNLLNMRWIGFLNMTGIELVRLNADGTPDTSFGNGGVLQLKPDLSDYFEGFAIQPDGQVIVAAKEISSAVGSIVDTPISIPSGPPPFFDTSYESDFVWQNSGLRMLRLNADGSLDSSFTAGNIPGFQVDTMGAYGTVGAITVQSDGKVVVAGEMGFGGSKVFVARFNADGSFDDTFDPAGAQPGVVTTDMPNSPVPGYPAGYGWVQAVAVDPDGKIVVGASESGLGMTVLGFNADGSADTGFGSNGIASYSAGTDSLTLFCGLAVQPDGKVVVAGQLQALPFPYSLIDPVYPEGLVLVRFNTDGSFDDSFGQQGVAQTGTDSDPLGPLPLYVLPMNQDYPTTGPVASPVVWYHVAGLVLQPNGDIVVAGQGGAPLAPYRYPPYTSDTWLVQRFNPDGSPDNAFGPGGVQATSFMPEYNGSGPAAVGLAPDGSVLVVGYAWYVYVVPFEATSVLLWVDYQDAPPGGSGGAPQSAMPPPAQSSPAASNAVFEALALSPTAPGTTPAPSPSIVSPAAQVPAPLIPAPLPVFTESQSAAVSRLSGGGEDSPPAFDPFGLTGDPDRGGSLVLAGETGNAE